jgi:hypothetical protein
MQKLLQEKYSNGLAQFCGRIDGLCKLVHCVKHDPVTESRIRRMNEATANPKNTTTLVDNSADCEQAAASKTSPGRVSAVC